MADVFNRDELARLEARVDAMIDTGVPAARYDGDGGGPSESPGSHPERIVVGSHHETCDALTDEQGICNCGPRRPDPVSEKAVNDMHALQQHVAGIDQISAAYPSITAGQFTIPGLTPCPDSKCRDCWDAEIVRPVSKKRYQLYCRRCGDYRKRNDHPIPPQAIKALAAHDGDWQHWSVQRALRAS